MTTIEQQRDNSSAVNEAELVSITRSNEAELVSITRSNEIILPPEIILQIAMRVHGEQNASSIEALYTLCSVCKAINKVLRENKKPIVEHHREMIKSIQQRRRETPSIIGIGPHKWYTWDRSEGPAVIYADGPIRQPSDLARWSHLSYEYLV